MAIVGRAQVLIEPSFDKFQRTVGKGIGQPLAQEGPKQGKNLGDRIIGGLGTALKVGAATTVAAGAGLIGTALVQGFGRLRALEEARAKLEGLGHSAQGVEAIMDDALAAVKGTAFGMGDAATVAASVVAAGVKPGKDLQRTLTLVGDAATIAGTDMSTMGSIVNKVATSDMMQMDVANQLMDAGIPILQMVAEEMGVTAEEARKMASDGKISFETFQSALETGVGGAAQKSGETLAGAFANTKAALGRIGASLLEPFYGMATGFLNWAMDMLGPIEDWAASIQPLIQDGLQRFSDWIVNSFVPAAKNVIDALVAIGQWVGRNREWIVPLTVAVAGFIATFMGVLAVKSAVDSVKTSFGALNLVMKANPIGLVIAGITALVAGLVWFFTQTKTGREIWKNFTDFLASSWEWVSGVFTSAVETLKGAWGELKSALGGGDDGYGFLATIFGERVGKIVVNTFGMIGDAFRNIKGAWGELTTALGGGDDGYGFLAEIFGDGLARIVVNTFAAIGNAFRWVGETIKGIWENIIKPAWNALVSAIQWVWTAVLFVIFTYIYVHWKIMSTAIKWAWEYILRPVWNAVAAAATWLWENVLSPVFSWIAEKWDAILLGMKLYWEYVLKPTWNAIAQAALWLWNTVLALVFTWIQNAWNNTLSAMRWAWDNILKPTWNALVATIQWLWNSVLSPIFTWIGDKWTSMQQGMKSVYDNYIKPMFDRFGEIVTNLKDTFTAAVDNIKKAWDKIKAVAAKPIKFVIEKVINEGLIDGFNKITGWIPGVNELKHVALPDWMAGYATGGYTGPGSKYQPAGIVHADEYVLRKEATNRLRRQYGLSGLDYMNRYGMLPGHADGGLVRPVRGRFTSGFGASRGRYPHAGVDWAVPVGTPVRAALGGTVARAGTNIVPGRTGIGMLLSHSGNRNTYYGHLSRTMVSVGEQVAKGAIIALSGNTGRSTGPHLHFETWTGGKPVDPMKYMGGLPASESGGEGGFDLLAPFRAIGEKITGWIKDKFPEGGIMVDAGIGAAKYGFDKLLSWAADKINAIGDFFTGGDKDSGSGDVRDQVRDVAAKYGWDSGVQWQALAQIIQKESSWNPAAANPNSSARGLFQKMTSLHGPVEKTAKGQAEWGLPYIKRTYGTPQQALSHHQRQGWYADGGLVSAIDNFMVRDRGGVIPPGLNMVLNGTGRDEYALTGAHMDKLVNSLTRESGPAVRIENAYALSTDDLARDITTQQRRARAVQLI